MAIYTRTSTTGLSWTNTAAWSPSTGAPITTADVARFDVGSASISAATATVGQIDVVNPSSAINIASSSGQVITLDPSASFSGIGVKFATNSNYAFSIRSTLVLGSDQTWDFGTSGKQIVVGETGFVMSGAVNLTLTGAGRFASTVNNTFGGAGKFVYLKNGMVCVPSAAGTLGSASNTIDVGPDAYLDLFSFGVNQTNFRVTGVGTFGFPNAPLSYYGAVAIGSGVFTSAKTLTFYGSDAAITLQSAVIPGRLTGTMDAGGYIEISANFNPNSTLISATNDFSAPGGLRVASKAQNNSNLNRGYGVGASDTAASTDGSNETIVFGAVTNTIRVMPTGKLYTAPVAGNTRKIRRNISFDGDPANTAINNGGASSTVFEFAGALTFSNIGGAVEIVNAAASTTKFSGSITGTGGLRAKTIGTVLFDSAVTDAFTNWTGSIANTAANVVTLSYGNGYDKLTNAVTSNGSIVLNNATASDITLNHSGYSLTAGDLGFSSTGGGLRTTVGTSATTITGHPALDVYATTANLVVNLPCNITGQLSFGFASVGGVASATYVVSGTNTRTGTAASIGWGGGNLRLNSNGALGNGSAAADAIVFTSAPGTLDNTSGGAVTLTNGGVKQFDANFSWVGTNNLSLGAGNVTWNAARTFTFTSGGGSGTLTLPGNATTPTAASTWNIGGQLSGGPYLQRLSLGGSNASTSTTGSVTAGYFRVANNDGLGAAATTTMWYVGLTTANVATVGAAIELTGNTTIPSAKNGSFRGTGPNGDGALRSVSGTNSWQGAILVPLVAGARFQVDAETFTLSTTGSLAYTNINPTVSATPLEFAALSGATMNQDRTLTNTVGVVTVNSGVGATGTVSFRAANANTGLMDVKAGTARFTVATAPGNGGIKIPANVTAQVATSNYKATFAGTSTFGTNGSLVKATLKIGN